LPQSKATPGKTRSEPASLSGESFSAFVQKYAPAPSSMMEMRRFRKPDGTRMGYRNLRACLVDLERTSQLVHIEAEIDPNLEMAEIQRRVYAV
jgi:hypothetical protein